MKHDNYIKRILLGLGGTSAILKSIAGFGDLQTEIWPQLGNWALLVAGIVALFNWIYSELQVDAVINSKKAISEFDIKTNEKLLALFNDDLVSFLKNQDMYASFRNNRLDPLFEFVQKWNNAKYQFANTILNQKLNNLIDISIEFIDAVVTLTFVEDGESSFSRIHIPVGEMSNQAHQNGQKLNDLATKTFNVFEDLQSYFISLNR